MNAAMTAISTVPARAALAGNPSDGYGGAVVALPVRGLAATVSVRGAPSDSLRGADGSATAPDHGVARLIEAARRRFVARRPATGGVAINWSTDIPRSVGLAGSSALVLATIDALASAAGVAMAPIERAAMALAVEVEDLGIDAGPQDRVVQAVGAPILMKFDEPGPLGMGRHHEVEGELLDEIYVAWSPAGAAPSAVVHGDLRRRWERDDAGLVRPMAELAVQATAAAAALAADDRRALDAAIDETFRLRCEIVDVDERTRRMVAAARSVGASANSAGSGGAIVGRCDASQRVELFDRLRSSGASVIAVE